MLHLTPHPPPPSAPLALGSPQVKSEEVVTRVTGLQAELRAAGKELDEVKGQLAIAKALVRQARAGRGGAGQAWRFG